MADDSPKPGDNPLLAGVEGAVRGIVPFGMGDALVQGTLGGFSPENWEKIASGERQRKEVNPGAAIAGDGGKTHRLVARHKPAIHRTGTRRATGRATGHATGRAPFLRASRVVAT